MFEGKVFRSTTTETESILGHNYMSPAAESVVSRQIITQNEKEMKPKCKNV